MDRSCKFRIREMQQPTPRPEKLRGGTRYTATRTLVFLNRRLPRQVFGAIQKNNEIFSTLGPSSFSSTPTSHMNALSVDNYHIYFGPGPTMRPQYTATCFRCLSTT
jgi:hypothetical protein